MCRRRRATNTLLRLFSIDSCLFVLQHETIDIYYLRRLVEIESESIKKTMKHSFNHGSTQYFSTISVRCEFLYLTSTRLLYIKINKFTRRCTSVKTNVVFGYKYLNICFKVLFFRSELKHTVYIHVCRNMHTYMYIRQSSFSCGIRVIFGKRNKSETLLPVCIDLLLSFEIALKFMYTRGTKLILAIIAQIFL